MVERGHQVVLIWRKMSGLRQICFGIITNNGTNLDNHWKPFRVKHP